MSCSERKPSHQPSSKTKTEFYTESPPSIPGIRRPPEGDYENAMKVDGNQDTSEKQQHLVIRNQQEQTVSDSIDGNTCSNQSTSLGDAKAVLIADDGGEVDPQPAVTSKENLHAETPNNQQISTYEEMSERTHLVTSQQAEDKRQQEQLVTSVTDKSLEVKVAEHGEDNSFQSSESDAEGGSLAVGLRNTSGVSDDMQMLNECSSTETLSHSSETPDECDSEGSGPGTSTSQFSRNNIPKVKEQREEKSPKVSRKQKSTQSQHRMGRQNSELPPCRKSETARHPQTSRSQFLQIGAPSDWNEIERQCSQEFCDVFLLYSNSDVDKAIDLTELLDHDNCTYREGLKAGKSIFKSLQEELDRCSHIVVLLTKEFVNVHKQRKFGDTSILKSLGDDEKKDFVIAVVYDLQDQEIPTTFKSITCLKKDNRFFDVSFMKAINKNKRYERIQEKMRKMKDAEDMRIEEELVDEIERLEKQLERTKRLTKLKKTRHDLQQQLQKLESIESDKSSPKHSNDCDDPCRIDQNSVHNGWVDDSDVTEAVTNGDDNADDIDGNINDAADDQVNDEDQDHHDAARRTSGTNSPQGVPGMKFDEQMQKTPSCDSFTQNSPNSGDFDTKVEDQHDTEEAGNGKVDDDEKITQDPTIAGTFERPQGQGDASCSPPSNQDVYGSESDDLQRYSGHKSMPAYADPRNLLDPDQSGDAGGNIPFIDSEFLPGTEPMNQSSKVTENNGCKSTAQSDVNGNIIGSAENQRTHSTPPIVPLNSHGSEQQRDATQEDTKVAQLYGATPKGDDISSNGQDARAVSEKQNGSHADHDAIEELKENDLPPEKENDLPPEKRKAKKKNLFRRLSLRRKKKEKQQPPKEEDENGDTKKKKKKSFLSRLRPSRSKSS